MKKVSLFFAIVILAISACEEQPVVIPMGGGGTGGPNTDTIFKTVLVEDLTGVRCPNCPRGAAQIEDMISLFGKEKVIAMSIHGRFLAAPIEGSTVDFRNDYARMIESDYGAFLGKPAAGINRTFFDGEDFLASADIDVWPIFVERELAKPADLEIELTPSYDDGSRTLTATVKVVGINTIENPLSISVLITQSGIIEKQESNTEVIEDYEHEHVLIGGMTPPLGESLALSLASEEELTKTFTMELPNDPVFWDPDHLDIVAFVSSGTSESKEVYYTISAKVK